MLDFEHHQTIRPHTRVTTRSEVIVVFFTITSHETHSASSHTLTLETLKV
jgi:hypothetical protein